MRKMLIGVLVGIVSVSAGSAAAAGVADPDGFSSQLQDAVTLAGVRAHQAAFQAAADDNGGTRHAGSPGYSASMDYVVDHLTAAGYDVDVQEFDFGYFEEVSPSVLQQTAPVATTYTNSIDFDTMTYSGAGDVTAVATAVDIGPPGSSTSGCEAADFVGFPAGNIAIIERGACFFALKAANAEAAGATGVVLFNDGQPGREGVLAGTLDAPGVGIPVVGASNAVGLELAAGGVTVRIAVDAISELRTTSNVVAQTTAGDPESVIVVGAHLDSVDDGPGINDNGSGSAAILEIALQLAAEFDVNGTTDGPLDSAVRFAWWGATEQGLLGSNQYVAGLSPAELAKIEMYLDVHMIGSPNFGRFIYDGDGSESALPGPAGSGRIEEVFEEHFADQSLPTEPTPLDSRSDYAAFLNAGIPVGGLFAGAEVIKTAEQVAMYGGIAGEQFDPCYHLACDTFDNVSLEVLDQNSDAAAHAIAVFAFGLWDDDDDGVPDASDQCPGEDDSVDVGDDGTPDCVQTDLSITKSVAPGDAVSGDAISYTLVVGNDGPQDAQNVTLSDTFPAVLEDLLVTDSGPYACGVIVGNTLSCTIAIHPVGVDATITLSATVAAGAYPDGTPVSNTASVGSDTSDLDEENNTSTADLSLRSVTLTVVKEIPGGGAGTFDITIADAGGEIVAEASLADGQSVAAINVVPGVYTVTESTPGEAFQLRGITCDNEQSTMSNSLDVSLAAGSETTCTITNESLVPQSSVPASSTTTTIAWPILPPTGSGSNQLVLVAALLVGLGSALVVVRRMS